MACVCVLAAALLLPSTRKTHRAVQAFFAAGRRSARNLVAPIASLERAGSTGKEIAACLEDRTGVNSVKNSIDEASSSWCEERKAVEADKLPNGLCFRLSIRVGSRF
ncbi:unnamed protein product [Acanthocheilonema viteae]|uniref:Uncharacterized protein n=1 Tax=Acanthocheilonema viteae TaxID=6277 RepID=A0A498S7F9_ACAVI|nr:unnamed protein product [Acanthocheilonema viteae]